MIEIGGYMVEIKWSEEDQAYLVSIPAFADTNIMPCSHGKTYEEAVGNARGVLELILMLDIYHPSLQAV